MRLPAWNRHPHVRARLLSDIDAWWQSAALRDLVTAFGGISGDLLDLDTLDRFCSRHWDFRRGRERDGAIPFPIAVEQESLIAKHAPVLGLADRENPGSRHYDAVILTGGMVRAAIVKPRFVLELRNRGVEMDRVVFLGGYRAFSDAERALARSLGVRGDDEVDGMREGVERAFALDSPPSVQRSNGEAGASSWGRWRWRQGGSEVEVVAAASADPENRRANTADTFRFWAERFADGAQSVLVVTTPVYVPYQSAVAVETLGLAAGLDVETVGVSRTASDLGPLTQPFTPQHHLQELRSAVHGMRSLRRALLRDSGSH